MKAIQLDMFNSNQKSCKQCSKLFFTNKKNQYFCSLKCVRKFHDSIKRPNPISDGHYVYVTGFSGIEPIEKREGFYCKIGYTSKSNLKHRSRGIKTGCPEKLEKYLQFGSYDSKEIARSEEKRIRSLWDKTTADNEWVFISKLNEDWLRQQSTPEYFERLEYVKQNRYRQN